MSPKDRIRELAAAAIATADKSHLEPPPRRPVKLDLDFFCSRDPLPGYDRESLRKRWEEAGKV